MVAAVNRVANKEQALIKGIKDQEAAAKEQALRKKWTREQV
jgi:hypothetical protein